MLILFFVLTIFAVAIGCYLLGRYHGFNSSEKKHAESESLKRDLSRLKTL